MVKQASTESDDLPPELRAIMEKNASTVKVINKL
jgi:hypothetical protein